MAIPISQLPPDLVYQGTLDVSNPVKQTKYNQINSEWEKQQQQSQPSSSSGSGFRSVDPGETIRAAIAAMQEANKPAVESLQASIPETQAAYKQTREQLQGSQSSLEQKYTNLLNKIKGRETADVTAQTKATNATLAARGLSTQDPGALQDMQGALQPIRTTYAGLEADTSLAQADATRELQNQIANLTPKEQSDLRSINSAIAQLQSGAGSQGLTAGLNLYGTNLQNKFQQDQFAEQQKQQAIENALAQTANKYITLGEGQTLYDPNTGKATYTAPKTFSPSSQLNSGWE